LIFVAAAVPALILAGHPLFGVSNAAADEFPAVKPRSPFDPRVVFKLSYVSRPDSALTVLDRQRRIDPRDPFVLLLKAKVLRERLNDEDNDKSLIKQSTQPIHAILDTAIALCDDALDRETKDPKYYFYRGYGWLNKAQLHVLTRGYWSAGRAAGKGKGDLERYLERYPDDPDARGMLGAYLYFADAIPSFVKFVAKLLLIPGGDRDKGLEMLEYGATHDGLFSTDWRMVLAAIHLVFEGHFELGSAEFASLLAEYPLYTRLVEPLGVVAPLYPGRIREILNAEETAIGSHLALREEHIDWHLVKRMQLHRAFTESYFGNPVAAMRRYERLIDDPPDHPDWVLPISLLNHGYFNQRAGRADLARAAYQRVRSSKEMKFYHDTASELLASLDDPRTAVPVEHLDFITHIYSRRPRKAREGIRRFIERHGESALTDFYAGDLEVMGGDLAHARRLFESAVDRKESGGDQIYQMFAALRLAELSGQEGRIDDAIDNLDNAVDFCHANYLFNFLVRSRKRFYELLKDGKIDAAPALLDSNPRTGTADEPAERG
jgi:tetratricopeptide (TPR) repeat protein